MVTKRKSEARPTGTTPGTESPVPESLRERIEEIDAMLRHPDATRWRSTAEPWGRDGGRAFKEQLDRIRPMRDRLRVLLYGHPQLGDRPAAPSIADDLQSILPEIDRPENVLAHPHGVPAIGYSPPEFRGKALALFWLSECGVWCPSCRREARREVDAILAAAESRVARMEALLRSRGLQKGTGLAARMLLHLCDHQHASIGTIAKAIGKTDRPTKDTAKILRDRGWIRTGGTRGKNQWQELTEAGLDLCRECDGQGR